MGGESAGGNLCAAVLLRRRDAHAAAAASDCLPLVHPPTSAAAATASGCLPIVHPATLTAAAGFPWRLANLVYGIFDVAGTPSVDAFGARRLVETARDLQYFADCYCPDRAARRDPEVSPLLGDLAGLPPAIFTAGTEVDSTP